ncbi:hypothetical protein Fmac_026809 [Flemingia macrophylla]|uniref:Uncharacterized protein n=1 Tax=Flemingia macrophylla TaxID=520843 RepID=A0ABD1LHM4_9FABA
MEKYLISPKPSIEKVQFHPFIALHLSCVGKAQSQSQETVKLHRVFLSRCRPLLLCCYNRIWHRKRSSVELNGRFESKCCHEMMDMLTHSYSEVGAFPHLYHVDDHYAILMYVFITPPIDHLKKPSFPISRELKTLKYWKWNKYM